MTAIFLKLWMMLLIKGLPQVLPKRCLMKMRRIINRFLAKFDRSFLNIIRRVEISRRGTRFDKTFQSVTKWPSLEPSGDWGDDKNSSVG